MSRSADHRPPPRLPYRAHDYVRRVEGHGEGCAVCPRPARNRVHDAQVLEQVALVEVAQLRGPITA